MKYMKILLIIIFLSISIISYGVGTIESNETLIEFPGEKPNTLNEWFYKLELNEKIEIYNWYNK